MAGITLTQLRHRRCPAPGLDFCAEIERAMSGPCGRSVGGVPRFPQPPEVLGGGVVHPTHGPNPLK